MKICYFHNKSALIWALVLLLFSCHSNSEKSSQTLFAGSAMTIPYRIIVGTRLNESQHKRVNEIIQETFEYIDFHFNKWNPNSEISKINQHKTGHPIPLSKELYGFLETVDQLVKITEGRFDPTVEPVQQLWKEKLNAGQEPSSDELNRLAPLIGWHHLKLKDHSLIKDTDKLEIDLGGVAKGLCVDLLVERLNSIGLSDLLVEWGGEIRASGKHPTHRPWTIYISCLDDTDPKKAIDIVPLHDEAIATSGDYLQNWTIENVPGEKKSTFFHIIDPKTNRPLKIKPHSIASVSILASNCVLADALATAAMLFETKEEALIWLKKIQTKYGISFWLITREASILEN